MSAQCSIMHKITTPVRSAFGQVASASRSVVAAARLHPAGFAVPSAVIVAAVAFVTFVTAVVVRVIPPNLFGLGSPPFIQPSTSQPRHRVHAQPVLAGPPILPLMGGIQRQGPAGSQGHSGSNGAGSSSTTLSTAPVLPITSSPTFGPGQKPTSGSPATAPVIVSVPVVTSGTTTQVGQTVTGVVGTAVTTVGQAAQGVTGAVETVTGTIGAATGAVTGTVSAVTKTVSAAAGTAGAVTNTVAAAASAVKSVAPVAVSASVGDSGQGGSSSAVQATVAAPAVQAGISAGTSGTSASVQVSLGSSAQASGGSAAADPASGGPAATGSSTEQTPVATATASVPDMAGNGSSQPAVSLSVSLPGLG